MLKFDAILIIIIAIIEQSVSLNQNESILLVYGSDVSFTCNITQPVKFFVNGAEAKGNKYEISDINMRIKSLKKADVLSSYFCNNTQGDTIFFLAKVTPRLYKVDALNFFGVSGQKVGISCYILVGFQNNLNIEWIWKNPNGETLNSTKRFEISSNNESSTLTIYESLMIDAGIYECTSKNAYGSHTRTLKLIIKSNLAPLWPFLGTIGQFFF